MLAAALSNRCARTATSTRTWALGRNSRIIQVDCSCISRRLFSKVLAFIPADVTTFLKKGEKSPNLPKRAIDALDRNLTVCSTIIAAKRFVYTDRRKDALPEKDAAATSKPIREVNFIRENARQVINSRTLLEAPCLNMIADSSACAALSAARKTAERNPNFLTKPDFGKVPDYLHEVKKDVAEEKDRIRQALEREHEEAMRSQPKLREMTDDERTEVCLRFCALVCISAIAKLAFRLPRFVAADELEEAVGGGQQAVPELHAHRLDGHHGQDPQVRSVD